MKQGDKLPRRISHPAALTAAFETKFSQVDADKYDLNAFVAEYEQFIANEIGNIQVCEWFPAKLCVVWNQME